MPYNTFGKFIPSYRKGQFGQSSTNGRRATDKAKLGRRSTDPAADISKQPIEPFRPTRTITGRLENRPYDPIQQEFVNYGPSARRPIIFKGFDLAAVEKKVVEQLTPKPKPIYSPTGRFQKDETTFGPGDIVEWDDASPRGKRFLVLGGPVDAAIQKAHPWRTGTKVRFTDGINSWTTEPSRLTPVGWLKR